MKWEGTQWEGKGGSWENQGEVKGATVSRRRRDGREKLILVCLLGVR